MQLLILGRQPKLGLAELESLFSADKVQAAGDISALVDVEPSIIKFSRLGGSVKCAQVLSVLPSTGWRAIEKELLNLTSTVSKELAEGKVQLGISAYGFHESIAQLTATGLSLKKSLRKLGHSVRLTPNVEQALSSAQVFHNHLTSDHAWEAIILRDGDRTIIARTTDVQDINSYTLRDRSRPKRDARVGMLPPKLAQIIINLAVGDESRVKSQESISTTNKQHATILDPFCGTGVLLQEALLMNYSVYGTDLEPRMIDYTRQNLDWLPTITNVKATVEKLEVGDATSYQWHFADPETKTTDLAIACETYLGKPFTAVPDPATLATTIGDCNLIIKKFLHNIHAQLPTGARLCIAVPAWQIKPNEFRHLPLIDQMSDLGYNRVSFEHIGVSNLLYYREDQVVARELLVITRK